MTKEEFVKTYYSLAEKAGKKYNLNPTVILAQAAHESGWGGSYAARVRKNFFGIIAAVKIRVHERQVLRRDRTDGSCGLNTY